MFSELSSSVPAVAVVGMACGTVLAVMCVVVSIVLAIQRRRQRQQQNVTKNRRSTTSGRLHGARFQPTDFMKSLASCDHRGSVVGDHNDSANVLEQEMSLEKRKRAFWAINQLESHNLHLESKSEDTITDFVS